MEEKRKTISLLCYKWLCMCKFVFLFSRIDKKVRNIMYVAVCCHSAATTFVCRIEYGFGINNFLFSFMFAIVHHTLHTRLKSDHCICLFLTFSIHFCWLFAFSSFDFYFPINRLSMYARRRYGFRMYENDSRTQYKPI